TPVVYCPRLERDIEPEEDPLVRAGYEVQRFKAFIPVLGLSEQRRKQMVSVGGNLMSFELVSSLFFEDSFSILHSHALGRIGAIALAMAKQRRVPFVVTIHGGVFDLPEKVRQAFNAPLTRGLEWGKLFGFLFKSHRLFRDADAILTCNPREAELLRERFPDKRIVVQPHGVEMSDYKADNRDAALEAFPQIRGRKVLLSLGRVDPIKNQRWLLEQAGPMFAAHPDLLLLLAGPCTDAPYGKEVERAIRDLGLENRVLLTGGLASDDPRLLGLLQQASALVLPSVSETFGLVLLEAWAAGTVVLASRTSGASALVEEASNGWLFDLARPAQFHHALAQVLSDPARAKEMARRGAEKVRSQYSIEAVAASVKRLYEDLLKTHSAN
ncbi:MAG TPA: glycosyltransferase family 4 protein, partial [Candidatus Dormibacteraeota bacterium]|nr:glycosyltransferase family 4 protein [Candidatus Dormibacteraeota bacterium]